MLMAEDHGSLPHRVPIFYTSAGSRMADCLYPISARIDQEGGVVARVVDVANARRTIVRSPIRHSGFPKRVYRCPAGRLEAPMSRRSIIWLITNFDRQVIPVWMVPIASLPVAQPKFGFANLRHAQCANDGVVEPFSSTDVGDRNGNVVM